VKCCGAPKTKHSKYCNAHSQPDGGPVSFAAAPKCNVFDCPAAALPGDFCCAGHATCHSKLGATPPTAADLAPGFVEVETPPTVAQLQEHIRKLHFGICLLAEQGVISHEAAMYFMDGAP
jgi:hypothetical protein